MLHPAQNGFGVVWKGRISLYRLTMLFVLMLLPSIAQAFPATPSGAGRGDIGQDKQQVERLLLSFEVNGKPENRFDVVYVKSGRAYVRKTVLELLRFAIPAEVSGDGQSKDDFLLLDDVPSLTYTIDRQALLLKIKCEAQCFQTTEISAGQTGEAAVPSPVGLGGFVNYDLNIEYVQSDISIGNLLEVGGFNQMGLFRTTVAMRDLSGNADFRRLDTSLILDDLIERQRLTIGDAISRNASWSQPVRFAGLKFGNEFSLNPGFVTVPTPDFSGAAALPSTIDVFVDGVRRFSGNVPAGPFEIRDLPVLTGMGQAQVIVRDLLGREQVFSESYATNREMLRAGLSDWSISAGFLREGFGTIDDDYGDGFLSVLYAQGINDHLTIEGHGQLSNDVKTAGASAVFSDNDFGVFNVAGAVSSISDDGSIDYGAYWSVGWNWSMDRTSLAVNYEGATPQFRTLGRVLSKDADSSRLRISAGTGIGDAHLSATYVDLNRRSGTDFRSVSLNYRMRLGRRLNLTINGFRQYLPVRSDAIHLTLTASFGGKTTGGLSANKDRDGHYSLSASVQRAPDMGGGFGYRARIGRDEKDQFSDGSVRYIGSAIEASAGWSTALGNTVYRGTARGGVVMAEGYVRPARYVTGSFAIVDLADEEGVKVYSDRRLIGKTASDGTIVIPNLRPFQKNVIELAAEDLPLDWPITSLAHVIVPSNRTGHLLEIEGGTGRSAIMTLKLPDGSMPSVGAQLIVDGQEESHFVGEDGYTFVAGLFKSQTATVSWIGRSCQVQIDMPDNDIPQVMLGEIECS